MADLKEYKKVITEIQENIGVSEESLTSLAQDLSEEQSTCTLLNNDTKMSGADEAVIDNTNSSEEISCVTSMKRNIKNGTSNTKRKRNPKIVNARTRSQKLNKTQSQNGFRTRRKEDQIDKLANSDTEAASEDRFTDLSEPEIEIQCKAKYIKLKPISKKDLEGIDLYVEVEIDKDLIVSPIEKYESPSCERSKYTFKVSSLTESKKLSRTTLQSEHLNADYTTSARVKNKRRRRELMSAKSKTGKTDTETRTKKPKQIHSEAFSVGQDSQLLVSQHVYDSETDIEGNGNETMQQTTDNSDLYVTDSVSEKLKSDGPVLDDDKNCIRAKTDIQEDKKVVKPKVRRKKETKPRSPKKERNKVNKEPTNQVDYATRITEDGDKMFGCPLCNYESKYSQNIRSHYLIHMNVKPWICEICGSAFVSKCNLRHHMVAHSNDRPFKCVTCGMGFKQKVVLQQHVARHNEDRQFVCEQCGKGFCISGDLKKHIRTHTGEKPYTCEICSKQFSDNSSYARHRYIHQEAKNYACTQCNKRFSRQDMCNSHMKTHNSDNGTGVKERKSKVKRTKKSDVDVSDVVGENVEIENREVAPREHLYHIENYAKEIQERTYTEMNASGEFAVVNNGYGQQQQQQQHQGIQIYPQRQETPVQESYTRDYTAMWTTNLHFY